MICGWVLDGMWMGPGWYVDGSWMVCGWVLDDMWMGPGWYVDGSYMGQAYMRQVRHFHFFEFAQYELQ